MSGISYRRAYYLDVKAMSIFKQLLFITCLASRLNGAESNPVDVKEQGHKKHQDSDVSPHNPGDQDQDIIAKDNDTEGYDDFSKQENDQSKLLDKASLNKTEFSVQTLKKKKVIMKQI